MQSTELEEQSNHVFPGFTSEQVQRLLSLIEPSKPGYEKLQGKSPWIINSGASQHMTGELQELRDRKHTVPIPWNLPNGANVVANVKGCVNLSSKVQLNEVIYVPNFACNRVSVAQLTRELKFGVIFDEDLCYTGPYHEEPDWTG